jgi:hypothetical protein
MPSDMEEKAATKTSEAQAQAQGPAQQPPGLLSRLVYASQVSAMQGATGMGQWYYSWADWISPSPTRPNIVKKYEARPGLPVRYVLVPQPCAECCVGRRRRPQGRRLTTSSG